MRLKHAAFLVMALAACQPLSQAGEPPSRAAHSSGGMDLPPMKLFSENRAGPGQVSASNADIARDFLDLAFRLESGRELPVLTRFEGTIRVLMTGTSWTACWRGCGARRGSTSSAPRPAMQT